MYAVLILGENTGTRYYDLIPDAHLKWISAPKGIDPGLLYEIDQVINEISPFGKIELTSSKISENGWEALSRSESDLDKLGYEPYKDNPDGM